jgi:hypothetical protein
VGAGWQRSATAASDVAHGGSGGGWGVDPGHDQPLVGGEDSAVSAVRGPFGSGAGTAPFQVLCGNGRRAGQDLPNRGAQRAVQGEAVASMSCLGNFEVTFFKGFSVLSLIIYNLDA